jgi:hypothetical protein
LGHRSIAIRDSSVKTTTRGAFLETADLLVQEGIKAPLIIGGGACDGGVCRMEGEHALCQRSRALVGMLDAIVRPKPRTVALALEARRSQASPQIQFEATLPRQKGIFWTGLNTPFIRLRAGDEIARPEIPRGDPERIFPGLNNFHGWPIAGRAGLFLRIPRTFAPVSILPKIMPLEALARGE